MDYHFIMIELAREFEKEIKCLGENDAKYKTFSVPITKELKRIGKNEEESTKTYPINYNLFIAHNFGKLIIKSC